MPYTAQEYIDDVRLRMPRYDVTQHYDAGTIEMLMNRARLDVQMATLQMFPERYTRELTISATPTEAVEYAHTVTDSQGSETKRVYVVNLPEDYIREVQVFVDDGEIFYPAREVTKRELFSTMRNRFSTPRARSPIYCIEKSPDSATYRVFVSKGAATVGADEIKLWYLARLPYLQAFGTGGLDDSDVRIGWDLQELVVLVTIMKIAEINQMVSSAEILKVDIQSAVAMIEDAYNKSVDREVILLPSREIIPNVGAPEIQGQG